MGSSPSKSVLRQAQVQILRKCEFCNINKDINYKCKQCQVYTCNKCGIIHKRSRNHDIIETGSDPPKPVHQRPEYVHQTQVFRKCGYCQNDRNIHYICSQCQTYICLKCSIIHQQLAQNHKINNIKSFHSVTRSQTGTTCEIHQKKLVKFCSSCLLKPVCSECILAHKDHHLLSLDDQTLIMQGIISKDLAFTSLALTQILKQEFENNLIFKN